MVEPVSDGKGMDLVLYETASGKRSRAVKGEGLTPEPSKKWNSRVFVNGKRKETLPKKSGELRPAAIPRLRSQCSLAEPTSDQARGDAPASSLIFAACSPDRTRVAYIQANNLCVEELSSQKTPS